MVLVRDLTVPQLQLPLPLLSDPSDFAPNTSTIEVIFEIGSQEENVSIGIIDDDSYENTESFTVVIIDISGDVKLGQNNSTQVNIEDDEVLIGSATLISPTTITEGEQIQYATRVVVPAGGLAVNLTVVFNLELDLISSAGEHMISQICTYVCETSLIRHSMGPESNVGLGG